MKIITQVSQKNFNLVAFVVYFQVVRYFVNNSFCYSETEFKAERILKLFQNKEFGEGIKRARIKRCCKVVKML